MANIELADLKSALEAEGVQVDEDVLKRAYRKLANPHGCENCGMHVKVGAVKSGDSGYGVYTACCNHFEQAVDEPATLKGRKRNG